MKIWMYKVKSDPCWRYRFYFGKNAAGKYRRYGGVGTTDKDATERRAYDHVGRLERQDRGVEPVVRSRAVVDLLPAWARHLTIKRKASEVRLQGRQEPARWPGEVQRQRRADNAGQA